MAEKHRIIIDTDTAGDDAAALIIAAKNPDIEILGVTVLRGALHERALLCHARHIQILDGDNACIFGSAARDAFIIG